MPKRYRRRSRRFSRRLKRRISRRRFRRVGGRRRLPLQWGNSKMVKLKYVDTDTPSFTFSGANSYASAAYKINSAYDVNNAIASTIMPGFGEYSQMFSQYRVMGCKIRSVFSTASTTSLFNVGIMFNNTLGIWVPGNWKNLQESLRANPHSRSGWLSCYRPLTISIYRPMGRLWGNTLEWKASPEFTASVATNPAKIMYGQLFVSSADGANPNPATIYHKTEVTMYIKFYRRDLELD